MEAKSTCEKMVTSLTLGFIPLAISGFVITTITLFIITMMGVAEYKDEYLPSVKTFDVNVTRVTFTSSLPVSVETLLMFVEFPVITDLTISSGERFGCSTANIGLAAEKCHTSSDGLYPTIYDAVIGTGLCSASNGCRSSGDDTDLLAMSLYTQYRCNDFNNVSRLTGNIKDKCNGFYPILTQLDFERKWAETSILPLSIVLPILYLGFVIALYLTLERCPRRLFPESTSERLSRLEKGITELHTLSIQKRQDRMEALV